MQLFEKAQAGGLPACLKLSCSEIEEMHALLPVQ
jgi:hypothetical protein